MGHVIGLVPYCCLGCHSSEFSLFYTVRFREGLGLFEKGWKPLSNPAAGTVLGQLGREPSGEKTAFEVCVGSHELLMSLLLPKKERGKKKKKKAMKLCSLFST